MANEYRSREERKRLEKPSKIPSTKSEGLWKKITVTLLSIVIVFILVGVGIFAYLVSGAPALDESKLKVPLSSTIVDKDGNVVAELGREQRTKVSYNEIPKVVEDAFIATEDVRFYKHKGVDIRRVFGAVLANITGGFGSQGGSTITQQVVKNSFLSSQKTIKRKVQEWYLAFKLEQRYSKHQILEMYLNKVYFSNGLKGRGVYGVAKACETYFSKDLSKITLPEAATLAGMVKAPNSYNPAKHPVESQNRRDTVLSQMKKYGYITDSQYNTAKAIPMKSLVKVHESGGTKFQSFIDVVVNEVDKNSDANVYTDGLTIETTLDPKAQEKADEILARGKGFYPSDEFQTGFVLLDTKTGEVRAVGAGRNTSSGGLNFATDIKRQPGSSIKPILDYGPAIQYLKWSTFHQILDEPYSYSNGTPIRNWDRGYKGNISIRLALVDSRNIPALKTFQAVGSEKSREFGNGLGFNFPKNTFYESYAIGGFTGVSAMEMAGAYAAFGNGGTYNKPHSVKKIIYPDKTEKVFATQPKQAMSDYTAYMVTDMLRDVVKTALGTGKRANVPGLDMAGKTGTTNYDDQVKQKYGFPDNATRDSWFIGYSSDVTMAVWTGYEKNKKNNFLGKSSTSIAKFIARDMLAANGNRNAVFIKPSSVEEIRHELYIRGEKVDDIPKDIVIQSVKNVKANYDPVTSNISINWTYPADLLPKTTFEVNYTVNGVSGQTQKIQGTATSINGIVPGNVVKITIIAINVEGKSSPVTVTVDLTSTEQPTTPPTNGGDQGNGNGEGNGNGNGTGEGGSNQGGDETNPGTGTGTGTGTGGTGENNGDNTTNPVVPNPNKP
ncbi:penicillin-binding protein [Bacillus sp. AFS002410]|uniref:transglycosylase domain-containing protein n=1 Tax=Bacillus sp. AFS002410 TaxID=2033481 RepID=UPI000BEF36CB|nr:PBP1A family penicillin-binding protein [Bacillus sp. AFS002410]PEJ59049.1 penicillin-binding protein [Bacillus sp. AFS002410]